MPCFHRLCVCLFVVFLAIVPTSEAVYFNFAEHLLSHLASPQVLSVLLQHCIFDT